MDSIAEQIREIGLADKPDESPQDAAERLWKKTGKDPLVFIKEFEHWARQSPERMLEVCGPHWYRNIKVFLSKNRKQPGAWRHSDSFRTIWRRLELRGHSESVQKWYAELALDPELKKKWSREAWRRKSNGVKRVYADVDVKTGKLISLIDKEFGPFAHIRVNGCELAEVTTEEALSWCDRKDVDARFVRALCALIPDPRKPIGEQWDAGIIKQAKEFAKHGEVEPTALELGAALRAPESETA